MIDTGDFYGSGHNDLLIREALAGRTRESVVLSIKFGELRDPAGGWGGTDNRPAALKSFLAQSLQRLGTDYVDIYRPARLDPNVPIEDAVGAMSEMVKAGYGATSACQKYRPRRSVKRTPYIPSRTCRSSTH